MPELPEITARTEVTFVSGFEPQRVLPPEARAAGLTHRFAVIQETFKPDCVDMFFDVPLYNAVLQFAETFEEGAEVSVSEWVGSSRMHISRTLAEFRATVAPKTREDDPGSQIFVRKNGEAILFVDTEFWTQLGGPMPYHDSYTYSLYSREAVGDRLRQFLSTHNDSSGWDIVAEVIVQPPAPAPSFWERLVKRLRKNA